MFETLNSCRRKLVCANIMPNVGKNLSWCALLPIFKKNQKRKLVSSQIRLVHFPHLRGQLWGVTTSQIHSFLSIFWHLIYFTYRCTHSLASTLLVNQYIILSQSKSRTSSITRGQSSVKLALCNVKTRSGSVSPLFTSSLLWNSLPSALI